MGNNLEQSFVVLPCTNSFCLSLHWPNKLLMQLQSWQCFAQTGWAYVQSTASLHTRRSPKTLEVEADFFPVSCFTWFPSALYTNHVAEGHNWTTSCPTTSRMPGKISLIFYIKCLFHFFNVAFSFFCLFVCAFFFFFFFPPELIIQQLSMTSWVVTNTVQSCSGF